MITILLNILIVMAGCIALIAGTTFAVWLLVHVIAPQTEPEEKPPPPRSAVE
jgi:hypothetical protein